jgi:hypothetical protein
MGRLNDPHKPETTDKAGKVTTPPLQKQQSKYGDKSMVKAVNPKKKGE